MRPQAAGRVQAVDKSYLNMHHKRKQMSGSSSSTETRYSIAYPEQVSVAVSRSQSENFETRQTRREREEIEKLKRDLKILDQEVMALSDKRRRGDQNDRRRHVSRSRREDGDDWRPEDSPDRRGGGRDREKGRYESVERRRRDLDTMEKDVYDANAGKDGEGSYYRKNETQDKEHRTDDAQRAEVLKQRLISYKHENDRLRRKIKQIEDTGPTDYRVKELQEENSKLKDRVKRRDVEIKRISSHSQNASSNKASSTGSGTTSDTTHHATDRHTTHDKAQPPRRKDPPTDHHGKPVLRRKPVYPNKKSTPGVKNSKSCVIS